MLNEQELKLIGIYYPKESDPLSISIQSEIASLSHKPSPLSKATIEKIRSASESELELMRSQIADKRYWDAKLSEVEERDREEIKGKIELLKSFESRPLSPAQKRTQARLRHDLRNVL